MPYPEEILDDYDDNGTMPDNVQTLRENVVGHKIVSVDKTKRKSFWYESTALRITLDNGKQVFLLDTSDCCAYTELEAFLLHPERVDHMITGVGTTGGYTTWHIFADMGDVLELSVEWGCGNPFYYGYGFEIQVEDVDSA